MGFFSNSDDPRYVVEVETYCPALNELYGYEKKMQKTINAQADKGYRLHSFTTTETEHGVTVTMVFEKI